MRHNELGTAQQDRVPTFDSYIVGRGACQKFIFGRVNEAEYGLSTKHQVGVKDVAIGCPFGEGTKA
jgi:hypothetical protein